MITSHDLFKTINGRISEKNQETLQKYVSELAKKQDRVVVADIGTCAGLSAITLATTANNVYVLTVDPEPKAGESVLRYAKQFEVEDRVKFFLMTSEEFGKNHCPELDACFLDASHDPIGIDLELNLIGTKVKKGGYILVHDKNLYAFGPTINSYEGKMYEFVEEETQVIDPNTLRYYGSVYVGRKI